jgi:hypothetical protein
LKEYALLELMEARAIVRTRPPPPGRLLKWAAVCGLQGAALLAGIAVDSPSPAVREEALRSIEIVLAREFQEIIVQACLHRIWSDELGAVGLHRSCLAAMWMTQTGLKCGKEPIFHPSNPVW